MIYTANENYSRALDEINNSNMSEEEKEAARYLAKKERDAIIAEEIKRRNKQKPTNTVSSGSSGWTITSSGSGSSSMSLGNKLDKLALDLIEGFYHIGKLIPPLLVATRASINLDHIANANNIEKVFMDPTTSKISMGLCAVWAALSLYGSHLTDKNKKIKKSDYGFNPPEIKWIGVQQLVALACIGYIFFHSLEQFSNLDREIKTPSEKIELSASNPVNKETNAVFLMAAAGLAYQVCSCYLKHKKISIRENYHHIFD